MSDLEEMWAAHSAAWREPAAVAAWNEPVAHVDPVQLRSRTRGDFWAVVEEHALTLLVSREYEHLVLALTVLDGRPTVTYLPLPHPSGIAYDAASGLVHIAATRNPNQLVTLGPLTTLRPRGDMPGRLPPGRPLIPRQTRFLPGCLYLHDLALIGDELHGNAVGENAVVRFSEDGWPERVWWPRAIEGESGPDFTRNYLQVNSIAAGDDIESSFFSASTDRPGRRRPGHRDFPVDGRGVVFSGATREPVARGLTRPHSARLRDGTVWVANSGYGTLGRCADGAYEPEVALTGWTRGLGLHGSVAFVGTSRVIPRFAQYAPGLEVTRSECGLHAVDLQSGTILGSLIWPTGNQIFAVEPVPQAFTTGFIQRSPRAPGAREVASLYYSFDVDDQGVTR